MKLSKGIFLIVATLALSACGFRIGGGSASPKTSDPEYSTPTPPSSAPIEHSEFNQNVGASGGQVKDPENNLTLDIPAGALDSETNITAKYIEAPEVISKDIPADFLGGAEFGPSGTEFNEPVTVTINLNKTPKNSELAVYCYYEAEDVWEYVTDAIPTGNKATFQVTHFSSYQVQDRTKNFLNEWTNMVRHAKVNGLSDSEILEAFREYLVNEVHILDQYTKYNGYWYEPCGLKISGQYKYNGDEGDPNALIRHEGESNRVGNKYGLCQIDGATSSRMKKDNATESQEIFDILVLVEYKIIKPDIELTASKKKLNKGESATINIRCHYTNAQNFYQEFKDLDLAGYMLTIAKPTHFSIDRSAVLTDASGRANFVVTAKENDQAETITVNFDVSGDFGTHAEGNITLGSDGYEITGHAKETLNIVYHAKCPEGSPTSRQNGSISLEVEYDITGSFEINEGIVVGTIEYSNISIELASTPCLDTYHYDIGGGDSLHIEIGYNIFATHSASPSNSVTYDLIGSYDKTTNAVSLSYGSDTQIGKIEGTTTGYGETMGIVDADGSGSYDTTGTITSGEQSISEYVLGSGPQDFSAAAFLDNFSFDMDYDFSLDPDGLKPTFPDLSNQTGSTIKTIEISGMAPIE